MDICFVMWGKITWENHGQPFLHIILPKKLDQVICSEAVKNR